MVVKPSQFTLTIRRNLDGDCVNIDAARYPYWAWHQGFPFRISEKDVNSPFFGESLTLRFYYSYFNQVIKVQITPEGYCVSLDEGGVRQLSHSQRVPLSER